MPTIYDLKPQFQKLLRPICNTLAQKGITANQVTLAALALSFLGGMFVLAGTRFSFFLLTVPVILFIRMALNAIDGMLAREHHMQSSLGAVLNEIGDVVSDVALYLPFALLPGVIPYSVVILVLLAVMVEMIGVVAVQIGASRRYDGPFGKSDRAFLFGLCGLLLGLGYAAGWWFDVLMLLAIVLSMITLLNRGKKALAEVQK